MSSVAQAIVDQIALWGVDTVFGVPGDDILHFLDALESDGRICIIYASHEAGASFMAANYSRLTGRLGVCVASAAGLVNLMEGLCSAHLDGLPVLAITGQSDTGKIGTRTKQYLNQQMLVANIVRFSELVTSETTVLPLMGSAAENAITLGGVGHISIPKDIWSRTLTILPAEFPTLAGTAGNSIGITGDIDKAIATLMSSKTPVILAGYESRNCQDLMLELARTLGAPVILTQEGKGALPETDGMVLSGVGETWMPDLFKQTDCVIAVGSASFERAWVPQASVIQVVSNPSMLYEEYRSRALYGSIEYVIGELISHLGGYERNSEWYDKIGKTKSERTEMLYLDSTIEQEPLHPARVMTALDSIIASDAIIAIDEGAFNHWFDRSVLSRSQTVLLSSRWRNMGGGIPGAIAAKVACSSRQVICIVGDGAMLMSLGELAVISRYSLDIKVVVINNYAYGLEIDKAEALKLSKDWLKLPTIDFAATALAFGLRGYRLGSYKELGTGLSDAFKVRGAAVIDIPCAYVRLPRVMA